MTGTDVIDSRAREILDDLVSGPEERWGDAVLIAWLNDGARLIADQRPESLLTGPYTYAAWADITALGDTIPISDRYRAALSEYVAGMALHQEAQDERDLARANSLLRSYSAKAGLDASLVIPTGR